MLSEYQAFEVSTSSGASGLDADRTQGHRRGERGGDDPTAEPSRGVDATGGIQGTQGTPGTSKGSPPSGPLGLGGLARGAAFRGLWAQGYFLGVIIIRYKTLFFE